ncbi:hypothetical protein QQ045_030904 [Rhodiola kirilowii]
MEQIQLKFTPSCNQFQGRTVLKDQALQCEVTAIFHATDNFNDRTKVDTEERIVTKGYLHYQYFLIHSNKSELRLILKNGLQQS